jgi:hypothetical protein
MSNQPQFPNATEFTAFATKLDAFRETLPQAEQRMFDSLVYVAFKPANAPREDVEGYWSMRDCSHYPGWSQSLAPALAGTAWAVSYQDGSAIYA